MILAGRAREARRGMLITKGRRRHAEASQPAAVVLAAVVLALAFRRDAELTGASTVKVLLNWDDKSAEALINSSSRSTSKVNLTGWSKSLDVTADGEGVVSRAGLALLRKLADKTGLAGGLSHALASPRLLIHDRGRVTADLACANADGGEVISDFRVSLDHGMAPVNGLGTGRSAGRRSG